MQVRRFQVDPLLAPYIYSIRTFHTEVGLSANDIRTVVPQGRLKLITPFKGSMISHVNHQSVEHPEACIMVIGAMEGPVVISSGPITSLSVEFRPGMAYRFLGVSMKELLNAMHPLSAVLGCIGEELQRQIEETPLIEDNIRLIQRFLAQRLHTLVNVDPLIDAAVRLIQSARGSLPVKTVCQELGYSKQYLERRFRDRVGLSPKMFSRILRFQSVYDHWMMQPASKISWQEHAELYYDQAHFVREFKQFTGFAPLEYAQQVNELMQAFYQP